MAKRVDKYANIMAASIQMTTANTLSFVEVLTGVSLGQGIGVVIDQIDYFLNHVTMAEVIAASDAIQVGWVTSNGVTALSVTDRRVLHSLDVIAPTALGTITSNGAQVIMPITYQFFPSMIFASPRLYLAIDSQGAGAAVGVTSRVYFRYVELTPQEYLEIAESFVLVG